MNPPIPIALQRVLILLTLGFLLQAEKAAAQDATVLVTPEVRSAVLFKNGFAFLRYEIVLPAGAATVRVEGLPVPSHGTFWVTHDADLAVGAVVAGTGEVESPVAVSDLKELLRANAGRNVKLWMATGDGSEWVQGRLLAIEAPEASRAESSFAASSSSISGRVAGSPTVVVLETGAGVVALRADAILRADFEDGAIVSTLPSHRRAAFLRIERPRAETAAAVTVTSLVEGLTWVPSYAIDISDPENAVLHAKAVVVNEAIDLDQAHVDLATGYPHALFGDVPSVLTPGQSISEFLTSLARRGDSAGGMTTRQVALTNAATFADARDASASRVGTTAEDLFLYPIEDVALRRGESAYLPLFSTEVAYRRVYTWDVAGSNVVDERWSADRGTVAATEPVWNSFRFTNPLDMPLTTAAAEFLKNGVLVGQDVCYFTAPGQETTVRINRTMNLVADAREVELAREHTTLDGTRFDLVTVRGELRLRSRLPEPADVEITRQIVGDVLDTMPAAEVVRQGEGLRRANPTHEASWKLRLSPGESVTASYEYQVYVH